MNSLPSLVASTKPTAIAIKATDPAPIVIPVQNVSSASKAVPKIFEKTNY